MNLNWIKRHLWWKREQNVNLLSHWTDGIFTPKTMPAPAWGDVCEWSRCSSLALTAARKTTLNSESESCGGLEQHPGRGAGWVTSLPSSNGSCVLENNGRNHILPSCPVASRRASGRNMKNNGTIGWAFSCSSGAQRAVAAAGGCIIPTAATGHLLTGGAVNPRSYSYNW